MCTDFYWCWAPSTIPQRSSTGWPSTYSNRTAAAAFMDPFQPNDGGLDDEAFMQSLEGAHERTSTEQGAVLLQELPVAEPSVSQVRSLPAGKPRSLPL